MDYTIKHETPLGTVILASNGAALTGLWFTDQVYCCRGLMMPAENGLDLPVLRQAVSWLDAYWQGKKPDPTSLPLSLRGTDFQKKIWQLLLHIPYGSCLTYGELARQYCCQEGITAMSAQAIGGAVSKNPISIIVPCHRIVGSNDMLTGYAGGIERKAALLHHEGLL